MLDIWQYSSSSSSSLLSKLGISKSLGSSSANLTFLLPNGSGMFIAMSECTILLKRGLTVMLGESNDEVEKISLCWVVSGGLGVRSRTSILFGLRAGISRMSYSTGGSSEIYGIENNADGSGYRLLPPLWTVNTSKVLWFMISASSP